MPGHVREVMGQVRDLRFVARVFAPKACKHFGLRGRASRGLLFLWGKAAARQGAAEAERVEQ